MSILSMTAVEIGRKIHDKEITSIEATEEVLAAIRRKDAEIGSFVTVDEEGARARAAQVQAAIDAGQLPGPLAGVPVAIKDNMCTQGMRTTCSSHILENYVPTYTAEAVKKLEEAGAVIIGKTNMDEFAMGSTTETSAFGVTKNPWNTEHVPGGSSGGSCAAVAAEEVPYALGSDTGGSIRQPSGFCGVTGMKPTYGTVSRYGLIAYGSSLDQIGPIAKDVTDCATILEIIAGYDPKDSTSVYRAGSGIHASAASNSASEDTVGAGSTTAAEHISAGAENMPADTESASDAENVSVAESAESTQVVKNASDAVNVPEVQKAQGEHGVMTGVGDLHFTEALVDDVQGMRIGIPRDYLGEGLQPEVRDAVLGAAQVLASKGAIVEEFDLGLVEYAIPAYYVIACAEASSNLARFDGVKYGYRTKEYEGLHNMYKKSRSEGFGSEVKRRIMLGSFVLSSGYYDAYYLKALRVKALIKKAFDEAFAKYDVILGPVAPTTAPKLGESLSDPLQMYLGDIYTISVNLAGLPGISLPCGLDAQGLPIGLQLIGDCFQEKKIIRAAYAFEQSRGDFRCTMAAAEKAYDVDKIATAVSNEASTENDAEAAKLVSGSAAAGAEQDTAATAAAMEHSGIAAAVYEGAVMKNYETVIGLEVHVELATKTKIFCGCSTAFGGAPNTHTCPVCTGQPGSLPVLNKQVVEYAMAVGLATNCTITQYCKFDRKNYFYPDNPQNYQISQLYLPICRNGSVEIETENGKKNIRIHEIHMEEDAGKLVHDEWEDVSIVDFNRSGVPLIEIVSEPDMRSADEVIAYLETLRRTIQYLGASDCKLNEGSMRADVNLSVREMGSTQYGTRTEMKNLNSFKAIAHAIEGERARQIELLEMGRKVIQETRRWDDNKESSHAMRSKEDAQDYRYFPEPDLAPVVISDEWIARVRAQQPEMRPQKLERYRQEYDIPEYDAEILTESKAMADLFEAATKLCGKPKKVSNWLMVETMRLLKDNSMDPEEIRFSPEHLAKLVNLAESGTINSTVAKEVFDIVFEEDVDPEQYVEEHGLKTMSDEGQLRELVAQIIAQNPQSVEDYRAGKKKAIGFLVGQTMKATAGKADPGLVNRILKESLSD